MVTIKNVSKRFGKKVVFGGLSLTFKEGRVIGLLGENAIGKTTLLKMIADILKPLEGEIRINGDKVGRHTRERVSFMLAPDNFYGFMKVRDAVQYYRDFYADFDHEKARSLCEEFGLEAKAKISTLSKGQQERLCILLCLCRRVPLYLLDEPIAGLDPKFKHESIKAMLANTDGGQTIIISSHLLRDLDTVFDEIVILKKDGVIMADCEEIRAGGESVEQFYLRNAGETMEATA
ncbi:MAG: ABC transporter ATP-binding protein [Defluviitaleaceae bacterium]|nr:ABC transporter ATP-binding protein [Defluviitaleaceae bacterium]MCL2275258.1 ABC transporter ATP-binding protein [Defluviitaleaceae bacterium]